MSETTLAKPSAAFGSRGIVITTYDELVRLSQTISQSGMSPKGMDSPQSIFVAIQMGLEVGLSPMAALQNVAVVNGRPTLWGDAQLAVCRGTGELESFEEWFEVGGQKTLRNPTDYKDDTTAVCRVKRQGGQPIESAFSVADAKRAGLWGKAGPWTQYPFRMLRNRARSFALRDGFGDALKGFRDTEATRDESERDVTPAPEVATIFAPKSPDSAPVPVIEPTVVEKAKARGVGKPTAPAQPQQPADDGMMLDVPAKPLREQVSARLAASGLKWADVFAKLADNGMCSDEFVTLEDAPDELLSDALAQWSALETLLRR